MDFPHAGVHEVGVIYMKVQHKGRFLWVLGNSPILGVYIRSTFWVVCTDFTRAR